MNVRNCKLCGRLFNYVTGAPYCPSCRDKMEAKFQEVKDYIRENPGVTMQVVADNCDVEPAQIRQWLREERLELTKDSGILLSCEKCGAPIHSGKYCEKCRYEMTMNLQSVMPGHKPVEDTHKKEPRDGNRMRFL